METLPGVKLSGSIFVIKAKSAKKIEALSVYKSEKEVLFMPNSQFKVLKRLETEKEKQEELPQLAVYGMDSLHVYVLEQL